MNGLGTVSFLALNRYINPGLSASGIDGPASSENIKSDEDPPNILFIMTDDLGLADINSFDPLGRTFYETPNIDKLAKDGMMFTQAYANASNCAPTRAALISGQYYPNQPIYHVGDSGPGAMIPAKNAHEFGPQQQGYDINIGGYGAGNPGGWEDGYFQPNNNPYIDDANEDEYLTDYLTRKAVEFVKNHQDKPFYLNLSYYTPHSPFQAPDSLVKKYERKHPQGGHFHSTYAAMIESLDTNVGKITHTLNELGIAENTAVIFYSDNGGRGGYGFMGREDANYTDNSPLKGGKGTFYEGGIRVPLIIRWPGKIKPESTSSEPVTSIDFYPTYLDLAGIEKAENYQLDGKSLTPLIQNPGSSLNREALYWHFPGYPNNPWRTTPVSVIRSGHWKLMKFYETGERILYNLDHDESEQYNLATTHEKKRNELEQKLNTWLEETHAPIPQWPE